MRDSDMMLDRDLPTVWTVRDGRAVRHRVFKTRADALEAVGLRESGASVWEHPQRRVFWRVTLCAWLPAP